MSSNDLLVPTAHICRYLKHKANEHNFHEYEVLLFQGFHGEMMVIPSWVKCIARKIRDRCHLTN